MACVLTLTGAKPSEQSATLLDPLVCWARYVLATANLHADDTQVKVPAPGNGKAKNVKSERLDEGKVRASITIDGAKATVRGTASKVGKKKPVHEELDDAGYFIVNDGTHRRLRNDLAFEYDGMATRLTCDPAFAYDLKVTKTPIV